MVHTWQRLGGSSLSIGHLEVVVLLVSSKRILSTTSINQNNLVKKTKKNENNISYLKKLEKIKNERKLQIERKFQKAHQQAMKTHPYFLNIQKSKAKKNNKKK